MWTSIILVVQYNDAYKMDAINSLSFCYCQARMSNEKGNVEIIRCGMIDNEIIRNQMT